MTHKNVYSGIGPLVLYNALYYTWLAYRKVYLFYTMQNRKTSGETFQFHCGDVVLIHSRNPFLESSQSGCTLPIKSGTHLEKW